MVARERIGQHQTGTTSGGSDTRPVYPEICVRVRSPHPLVMVSAVRQAMRRAGIASEQVARFSRQALTCDSAEHQRQICSRWVRVRPSARA